jgi:hypothetical protein
VYLRVPFAFNISRLLIKKRKEKETHNLHNANNRRLQVTTRSEWLTAKSIFVEWSTIGEDYNLYYILKFLYHEINIAKRKIININTYKD